MHRSEATVEQLIALLPEVEELEQLRLALIGAAVPDPGKAWDSSIAFSTVDKRIVGSAQVEAAITTAAETLRHHTDAVHEGLRPVFRAFFDGRPEEAARALVRLGEQLESGGRLKGARQWYRTALATALPFPDKAIQILALRRVARVSLALGDFGEAASFYERSAQLARDADDTRAEVVALTGRGNVFLWQGRWLEAEERYQAGLALISEVGSEGYELERGQLYNNLGNITVRLQRLDEAEAWVARALDVWQNHPSSMDAAVCHTTLGHLRVAQARPADARKAFERALSLAEAPHLRSAIATDLAELCLHEGHVSQAEEWGRVAEEDAISSGSAYSLGRMYQGRGNIARVQGDEDGFTFFEKALQIALERGYPYLEAEVLRDYAQLRRHNGGREEAVAYLERARDLFQQMGALEDLEKAEAALAEIRGAPAPKRAPAAAAGD